METKLGELEKEVRFLRRYTFAATLLCSVFILAAFTMQGRKQKFEEIDVERVNIVEKDGQVKLVISNKERLPGPGNIVKAEFGTRVGLKMPGMLFYNEKGDECGGWIFGSKEQGGKYGAGAGLLFDKYNGDQVMGLLYDDGGGGKRTVGFNVWDQPDVSPEEQKKNYEEARKLKDGPEKDALRQQSVANQRVFIGRTSDKEARITLFDANSRPRIRLSVRADGEAKMEFLDGNGKVLQTLPAG